jgi:hypothetical protein
VFGFGLGLEEDHATDLEDILGFEVGCAHGLAGEGIKELARNLWVKMLPASEDVHSGRVDLLDQSRAPPLGLR